MKTISISITASIISLFAFGFLGTAFAQVEVTPNPNTPNSIYEITQGDVDKVYTYTEHHKELCHAICGPRFDTPEVRSFFQNEGKPGIACIDSSNADVKNGVRYYDDPMHTGCQEVHGGGEGRAWCINLNQSFYKVNYGLNVACTARIKPEHVDRIEYTERDTVQVKQIEKETAYERERARQIETKEREIEVKERAMPVVETRTRAVEEVPITLTEEQEKTFIRSIRELYLNLFRAQPATPAEPAVTKTKQPVRGDY